MRSSAAFLVAALASVAFAAPQGVKPVTLKSGLKAYLSVGKPANVKAAVGDFQCPDGSALVRLTRLWPSADRDRPTRS